jgi:hypothetical protein
MKVEKMSNPLKQSQEKKNIPLAQAVEHLRTLVFTLNNDFKNFINKTKYNLTKDGTLIPELKNHNFIVILSASLVIAALMHYPRTLKREQFRFEVITMIETIIKKLLKKNNLTDFEMDEKINAKLTRVGEGVGSLLVLYQLKQPAPFYLMFVNSFPISNALSKQEVCDRFDDIFTQMYKTAEIEVNKLFS